MIYLAYRMTEMLKADVMPDEGPYWGFDDVPEEEMSPKMQSRICKAQLRLQNLKQGKTLSQEKLYVYEEGDHMLVVQGHDYEWDCDVLGVVKRRNGYLH